jgi:hypothetical protein
MHITRRIVTAAAAAGLVLSLGTATAARADTPTPDPTATESVTPQFGLPPTPCPEPTIRTFTPTAGPADDGLKTPRVHPTDCPTIGVQRFQRQTFTVALTSPDLGGLNVVNASGPVNGTGGTDTQVSNTQDRFRFFAPFRRVNVLHTGIAAPVIHLATCTATVSQTGLWAFAGGLGAYRFAAGTGVFRLGGLWVFPRIRGVCSLLFLRGNPLLQNRIQPTSYVIAVRGVGVSHL